MTDTILCIDVGTSSLKAAFLSDNLRRQEIVVSRKPFPKSALSECESAAHYLPALKAALSELREKSPGCAVEAVCISGNGPTVISDDGTTLLYSDVFALSARIRGVNKAALKASKSLFIPRLVGFRAVFKEKWAETRHIFGAPEYLIHQLTGKAVTILPDERFSIAYWTDEELKDCGFSDSDIKKLPPFVRMGAFAGKINERAARETGLLEGTLVFAGASDFVAALIGTGTVFPGRLCDRAGTSEALNLCTAGPVFAEGLRTMPGVLPGMWNLSYLMRGGGAVRGLDSLGQPAESASYFDELSHGVARLREAAAANGEIFPDSMTITGGQALSAELVAAKESATGMQLRAMPCADAELIGDLILARVSLGDYDDIEEAVFAILGA